MQGESTRDTPRPSREDVTATRHDGRVYRLTVSEAAEKLGVSPSAIRKRVERGTLVADKDEDGRLLVYVDTYTTRRETPHDTPGRSQDGATTTHRDIPRQPRHELVEELREHMEDLREQVGFLRSELERKDVLLMTLAQRVPELEAVRDARGSPDSTPGAEDGAQVPPEQQKPSWWRWLLGVS